MTTILTVMNGTIALLSILLGLLIINGTRVEG